MQKDTDNLTVLLGSACVKAVSKHVGEIDPSTQMVKATDTKTTIIVGSEKWHKCPTYY